MQSFHEIMDAWSSDIVLAEDLQIPASHARTMRARGSIPAKYWTPLVAAAQRRGIKGVTIEVLAEIKAAQRRQPEPKPPVLQKAS